MRTLPCPLPRANHQPALYRGAHDRASPGPGAPQQRVLEVGSGCGYQTAVLSQLADRVWTVERIGPLLTRARRHWSQLKLRNITARLGDGFEGWADRGPFDGICSRRHPGRCLQRCWSSSPRGRFGCPVGDRDGQVLERHWREGSVLKSEVLEAVRFVPMLGGTA